MVFDEHGDDNWVIQNTQIYPLKMRDKGMTSKSKKRKINWGKLVLKDFDFYRPSFMGPFKVLIDELCMV